MKKVLVNRGNSRFYYYVKKIKTTFKFIYKAYKKYNILNIKLININQIMRSQDYIGMIMMWLK